jgi:hypothetical protein
MGHIFVARRKPAARPVRCFLISINYQSGQVYPILYNPCSPHFPGTGRTSFTVVVGMTSRFLVSGLPIKASSSFSYPSQRSFKPPEQKKIRSSCSSAFAASFALLLNLRPPSAPLRPSLLPPYPRLGTKYGATVYIPPATRIHIYISKLLFPSHSSASLGPSPQPLTASPQRPLVPRNKSVKPRVVQPDSSVRFS